MEDDYKQIIINTPTEEVAEGLPSTRRTVSVVRHTHAGVTPPPIDVTLPINVEPDEGDKQQGKPETASMS